MESGCLLPGCNIRGNEHITKKSSANGTTFISAFKNSQVLPIFLSQIATKVLILCNDFRPSFEDGWTMVVFSPS